MPGNALCLLLGLLGRAKTVRVCPSEGRRPLQAQTYLSHLSQLFLLSSLLIQAHVLLFIVAFPN